jgi:hypothetical protein
MMMSTEATDKAYNFEKIDCTKHEYESIVRNALLDFELRSQTLGDEKRQAFTRKEIDRLDKLYKIIL